MGLNFEKKESKTKSRNTMHPRNYHLTTFQKNSR